MNFGSLLHGPDIITSLVYSQCMDQQQFWEGSFGIEYIDRNASSQLLASNVVFFSKIFSESQIHPKSILELGANIGLNLRALKSIFPTSKFTGVEVNKKAFEQLKLIADEAYQAPIEDFSPEETFELVFTKGVLIHISPSSIQQVYESMSRLSKRYVLFAEYFSRETTNIPYRGHTDVLFKRDFLAEFMRANKDTHWELRHYGFVSRNDTFPQDDLNWYLLEKR